MSYASLPLNKSKKQDFKAISKGVAFCDFETRGLGGEFLYGAIVGVSSDNVEFFSSIEELIELLFENGEMRYSDIFFHNLEYDARYLVDHFIKTGEQFQVINRVSRVLMIKVGKFTFIDSYALLSDSLKNLSKVFAPTYEKKTLNLDKVIFDKNNKEHIEYLRYDVLALKHVYIKAREVIHEIFGVNAKFTTSSTALSAWLTTLDEDTILFRVGGEKEDLIRMSYHGGMVYLKEVDLYKDITVMDFNSMYPSVMRDNDYPYGSSYLVGEFDRDRIGFYKCKVDGTKAKFLFLVGYVDGKKVPRCEGKFTCYLSTPEYYLALELGYKVRVIEGVVFEDKKKLFKKFVDVCERTRIENGKNALGAITKLIQNSLYGKFGTKPIREQIFYSPELLEDKTPFVNPTTGEFSGLYIDEVEANENYMLPHLASYTTALARCRLVRAVIQAGVENVVYCDTDSLFVNEEGKTRLLNLVGVEYGKLKIEEFLAYVVVVAPKLYFGSKNRAKGFPKSTVKRLRYFLLRGDEPSAKFDSLNSVRSILKQGKKFSGKMTRRIKPLPKSVLEKVLEVSRHKISLSEGK